MNTENEFPICKLKMLRKEKKMTQEELASEIGCDVTTIRNIEGKRTRVSTDLLILFCNFFKVSTDFFLGRSDCRSVDNDYLKEKTGLSDNSIQFLENLNQEDIFLFNRIIESGAFDVFIGATKDVHMKYAGKVSINNGIKSFEMLPNEQERVFDQILTDDFKRAVPALENDKPLQKWHSQKTRIKLIQHSIEQFHQIPINDNGNQQYIIRKLSNDLTTAEKELNDILKGCD